MLNKIQIFSAEQAAELNRLKEREFSLASRAQQIENRHGEGLRAAADRKIADSARAIREIERSQNPEDVYYITDDAKRAANLERKAALEVKHDQAQAEVDAFKLELQQIKTQLNDLEAEIAPFEVLKEFQNKLNESWPMIVAGESALKSATSIGPDLVVAVLAPLFDAYMDCVDKMDPQLARKRKQSAKALKADYDAFVEAGFRPDQAMDIVLARVKANNLTTLLNSVSASKK